MVEIPDWVDGLIMGGIALYFMNWEGAIKEYRRRKNEQKISEKSAKDIYKRG